MQLTVGYLCRSAGKITVCFTVEDIAIGIEKSNLSSIYLLDKKAVNNFVYPKPDHNFKMNVLVVKDNLINQKKSKIMLEEIGCQVDIALC